MIILIVGLGSIARKHLLALEALSVPTEIYALRSSKNTSKEKSINNIYSLDELKVKPDFALISNPTSEHYTTIETLVELGCPLFIEKPSLNSLQKSEWLATLVKEKNILTYVACNLRFHPCISYIKNYLNTNRRIINEVNIYCGSYLPDWRPGKNYLEVYSAKKENGGGVHLDLIHEIDYAYWIFGKPAVVSRFHRSKSSIHVSSVDYANYTLEYEKFAVSIILNYYRRDPKRSFEILFDNETWLVDLLTNTITSNGKIIFESGKKISDTYLFQMEYFLDCLKQEKHPMNDFLESLDVLKICLGDE